MKLLFLSLFIFSMSFIHLRLFKFLKDSKVVEIKIKIYAIENLLRTWFIYPPLLIQYKNSFNIEFINYSFKNKELLWKSYSDEDKEIRKGFIENIKQWQSLKFDVTDSLLLGAIHRYKVINNTINYKNILNGN